MRDLITKNKELQKLLDEPITRSQFMKQIGIVMLSIVGVNAVLNTLLNSNKSTLPSKKASKGFGGGKFGV